MSSFSELMTKRLHREGFIASFSTACITPLCFDIVCFEMSRVSRLRYTWIAFLSGRKDTLTHMLLLK